MNQTLTIQKCIPPVNTLPHGGATSKACSSVQSSAGSRCRALYSTSQHNTAYRPLQKLRARCRALYSTSQHNTAYRPLQKLRARCRALYSTSQHNTAYRPLQKLRAQCGEPSIPSLNTVHTGISLELGAEPSTVMHTSHFKSLDSVWSPLFHHSTQYCISQHSTQHHSKQYRIPATSKA